MSDKKRVFIVDGYGQIYRSYFAFMNNPLKDREGNNVSAVYGFFNTIMSLIRQYSPEYLVVAMDAKGKTFRHEMYDQYKANREKTPEDLHAQIPVIDSFLDGMHIPHFSRVGMEADDIIATIARKASENGIETVMVTGDKDLLQLVRSDVFALRPPRKGEKEYRLCAKDEVRELFGVGPEQIIDYLTILGDSSDNVPGINGIGEKGAIKLLSEYGSLSKAYESIASLPKGIAAKLEAARDHVELSRTLVTLRDDVLADDQIEFASFDTSLIDWKEAMRLFRSIGSESLAKAAQRLVPASQFSLEAEEPEEEEPEEETPVAAEEKGAGSDELDAALSALKEGSFVGLQVLLSEEDEMRASIVEIRITCDGRTVLVLQPDDQVKAVLQKHLPGLRVIGHDLKSAFKALRIWGLKDIVPYADTMLAKWLLETSVSRFDAEDCCTSFNTLSSLEKKLEEKGLLSLFREMEMPLCDILCNMEMQGILLDCPALKTLETEIEAQIEEVLSAVYELCGKTFNLNSPKQLQEVLFVDRNLPTGKKTKSGFSTDSDVLEELSYSTEDPVPALILRYRILSKLLGTYVKTLPELVNPRTGRLHTTFLQTGTATGRLSSKNPNLQNIPVRTDEGRKIRDAFVPKEGCTLMSADYSQIELVVLSHVSGDVNLRSAFLEGNDVHRETAARMFDIFPEMVTPEQRRMAKTINFGIMYGMSSFRLAGDLKISRKSAQEFIDRYFERYSGVSAFIEKVKAQAYEDGYVRTAMGHIRYIPEIKSSNKTVRSTAERVAVNTVIQGTAAEIMKLAMIAIDRQMKERNLGSRMLLQVHDEVIFEVPESETEEMKELVRTCMENAMKLSVPLKVGLETAGRWGEMH